ncbi:predicted protein [Nematostella vectensis]|uniref:CHHC U11-48K-type domain-containing protein n=1 Tax=Nematostella vectensis TaxID=45351 RepID=A7SGL7_NEMVE|nr:predicted protein [Nematostella vectensis]|eukprot:XP_001629238.1 predicted protein [Nematostella vectensis]
MALPVGPNGEMLVCPYDPVHIISAKRFQYHILKCRKNHPDKDFVTCPFNAKHIMLRPDLRHHIARCPDRAEIDKYSHRASEKDSEGFYFKGDTSVPSYMLILNPDEREAFKRNKRSQALRQQNQVQRRPEPTPRNSIFLHGLRAQTATNFNQPQMPTCTGSSPQGTSHNTSSRSVCKIDENVREAQRTAFAAQSSKAPWEDLLVSQNTGSEYGPQNMVYNGNQQEVHKEMDYSTKSWNESVNQTLKTASKNDSLRALARAQMEQFENSSQDTAHEPQGVNASTGSFPSTNSKLSRPMRGVSWTKNDSLRTQGHAQMGQCGNSSQDTTHEHQGVNASTGSFPSTNSKLSRPMRATGRAKLVAEARRTNFGMPGSENKTVTPVGRGRGMLKLFDMEEF